MKTWTTQAERRLEEYLLDRAARERLGPDDAAELKEDLRRHVYEEAERQTAGSVGLMQLETILGGMDAGYRWVNEIPDEGAAKERRRRRSWAWACGVVLPVLLLVFEAASSFCGGVFFDPIPTWWHFGLVALVPGLNAWLLRGGPRANERWMGAAAGVAVIVAGFYALLFLPLIHWSVLALLFVGMGMLSLTPIFAWAASWRIGRAVKMGSASPQRFQQGWWAGAGATVLILLLLEGPSIWTRLNVSQAMVEGGNPAAVSRLRAFHSERTLLKACYEGRRGMIGGTDIAGWMGSWWKVSFLDKNLSRPNFDGARDLYFRVTGKPFSSAKPPRGTGSALMGGRNSTRDFSFDDHLGGDEVAVRLKNLDLKESRFDGHVDSVSRIGYGEWTMIFRNGASNPQEARCQVKLPRGGRVSRLTLWVNGEPREAAFSSVSKVKAAYKEVAVVQRRDPVLVTMAGPDTVLVQCFPVPAHGEMKIRFGVTAALDEGRWELPRIVERNFGTAVGLEHSVWLQADRGFGIGEMAAVNDGTGRSLTAALAGSKAMGEGVTLTMEPLSDEPAMVWCEDRFAKAEEKFLIREPRRVKVAGSGKVVVVIDGSIGLAGAKDWLVGAMGEGVIAILADDTARRVDANGLAGHRFSGGRDNAPGLREGIRVSKENGGLPIVWVHGPQAVEVAHSESLLQSLERGTTLPVIHSVEAGAGPNRLAEAIYKTGSLKRGPKLMKPAEDFRRFLSELREGKQSMGWTWRRSSTAEKSEGTKVWDQLARLWACGAAEDPMFVIPEDSRPEIAARYQLVTQVSGAVVLETQEQYTKHGLTPVDAEAAPKIPGVPEPSTAILLVLTSIAALMRRKRIP